MRAMNTANQVDGFGRALSLDVGTRRENTGVRKRSKPAIKAHLEADVSEMPHCWKPDAQKFMRPVVSFYFISCHCRVSLAYQKYDRLHG